MFFFLSRFMITESNSYLLIECSDKTKKLRCLLKLNRASFDQFGKVVVITLRDVVVNAVKK